LSDHLGHVHLVNRRMIVHQRILVILLVNGCLNRRMIVRLRILVILLVNYLQSVNYHLCILRQTLLV
jgi:hypothetical protein